MPDFERLTRDLRLHLAESDAFATAAVAGRFLMPAN